jgi:hypothetical protein
MRELHRISFREIEKISTKKTGKILDRLHGFHTWIVQGSGSPMGWGGRLTMLR